MRTQDKGIRTIHDAIDAKTRRILDEYKAKRSSLETKITKDVYDKLGLTQAYDLVEKITGRRPYDSRTSDSILDKELKEAEKALKPIDERIKQAILISENAHIAVVTEDKGDVLSKLDEQLSTIK